MSESIKLATHALCVFYGSRQVLGPIDMTPRHSHLTILIGPQRAGKTTLMRSLNRLIDEKPGARIMGDVCLDGQSIFANNDRLALTARIGMVFPEPTVFPGTIHDNLTYALSLRGICDHSLRQQRVEHALLEVDLWNEVKDRLLQNANLLTAEQQQRLCIARTLALHPEVLLLDEPWKSIDIGARTHLEEVIRSLRGKYTILAAVADMGLAGRIADDAAVVFDGKIIEYGPAQELFYRPKEKRTSDFITGRLG